MKNLRVAILTEIINYHSGSRAPLEIAKHLAQLNQNVTVYAYDTMLDRNAYQDLKKHGVKMTTFNKPSIPFFGKYLASVNLYKSLLKDKPHIMTFSGTPPFFFAALLTRIPVVRIYQGTQFDAYLEKKVPDQKLTVLDKLINKLANIYIYLVDFASFRLSNAIVAISKYSKIEGENLYKRKVAKVIYHGTSKLIGNPQPKKQTNTINIISVSRLTPYKGFHLIIKALKKVHTAYKIRLIIVGSQPKQKYIRYLKKIGKDSVQLIIDPTDRKLAALYQRAHIYASADRYLYFGLPICEAAQFQIPAVSLNLAAAKEIIVHNKTGFIAESELEFTAYLEKLINNPNLRQKMGQAAQIRTREIFTWEKTAREYLSLFEKIVH